MTRLSFMPLLACLVLLYGCDNSHKKTNDAAEKPLPKYNLSAASNKKFLADFAAKPGVVTTSDGLEYRILRPGTGRTPQSGADMVTVKYKGTLINGTVFDQTRAGQTATFPAGGLIPGWVEALSMMKEGAEWQIVIPAGLGYGPDGSGNGTIPGGQTLIFDMTLVSVKPASP